MPIVEAVYKDQFLEAKAKKNANEILELARRIFRDGEATGDDPVARFAMWKVARSLYLREKQVTDALATTESLGKFYEGYDYLREKLEVIREASGVDFDPRERVAFIETVLTYTAEASAADRHELATDAAVFTLQTFDGRLTSDHQKRLTDTKDQSSKAAQQYAEFRDAIERLSQIEEVTPEHENLSLVIGRYLVVARNDWEESVHYLAACNDPILVRAAEREVAANSQVAGDVATAIAWKEAGESVQDRRLRNAMFQRSLEHYDASLPTLEGLSKREAEMQRGEIAEILESETDFFDVDPISQTQPVGRMIGRRTWKSGKPRNSIAKVSGRKLQVGMGNRVDGIGAAAAGVELAEIGTLSIEGAASHEVMEVIDGYSKVGFVIDYHTPGGYTKRVYLGLGMRPAQRFSIEPEWGTHREPDFITDIGKQAKYEIEFKRWAPANWDGRCWFTLMIENAGRGRQVEAKLSW